MVSDNPSGEHTPEEFDDSVGVYGTRTIIDGSLSTGTEDDFMRDNTIIATKETARIMGYVPVNDGVMYPTLPPKFRYYTTSVTTDDVPTDESYVDYDVKLTYDQMDIVEELLNDRIESLINDKKQHYVAKKTELYMLYEVLIKFIDAR